MTQIDRWVRAILAVVVGAAGCAALLIGPLPYGTGINALQVGGYLIVAVASLSVGGARLARRPSD